MMRIIVNFICWIHGQKYSMEYPSGGSMSAKAYGSLLNSFGDDGGGLEQVVVVVVVVEL